MKYQSTRGDTAEITAAEAIAGGLSADGGLYVPKTFPVLSEETIKKLTKMKYAQRAAYIMGLYLTDYTAAELTEYANSAYNTCNFDAAGIAPLHKIDENTQFLELWHGPTCAFKDMALQVMPHLLTAALQKTNEKRGVCILVATSGDTGKAALEGYKDVPGTKIMVFYPHSGVSNIQKLQMDSQTGGNVCVVAIDGNFDDAQTGVKKIFSDRDFTGRLSSEAGVFLSSANSINWGRLVPQIAYYVSAYCDLIYGGRIVCGDKINFCVPTGNFGNILAAYYAKQMGLPVGKLICASNRNDVLTQFFNTGTYDKNRPFYTTASPAMDILVSSNLERLLFELTGKDGAAVRAYMEKLSGSGAYDIPPSAHAEAERVFACGRCNEEETMRAISDTFKKHRYLIDTHTAVAYKVLGDYREKSGDDTLTVVVSTASPYKFCEAMLTAFGETPDVSGVCLLDKLADVTGTPIPPPLDALRAAQIRFTGQIVTDNMKDKVEEFLRG